MCVLRLYFDFKNSCGTNCGLSSIFMNLYRERWIVIIKGEWADTVLTFCWNKTLNSFGGTKCRALFDWVWQNPVKVDSKTSCTIVWHLMLCMDLPKISMGSIFQRPGGSGLSCKHKLVPMLPVQLEYFQSHVRISASHPLHACVSSYNAAHEFLYKGVEGVIQPIEVMLKLRLLYDDAGISIAVQLLCSFTAVLAVQGIGYKYAIS